VPPMEMVRPEAPSIRSAVMTRGVEPPLENPMTSEASNEQTTQQTRSIIAVRST
jgi:hypothetical protein